MNTNSVSMLKLAGKAVLVGLASNSIAHGAPSANGAASASGSTSISRADNPLKEVARVETSLDVKTAGSSLDVTAGVDELRLAEIQPHRSMIDSLPKESPFFDTIGDSSPEKTTKHAVQKR